MGEFGFSLGYEAEILKTSLCSGLGVAVCNELSPDGVALKIGGSMGLDTAHNFESGSDSSRLQPKLSLEVEFSYSTSDDAGSAGPMAVSSLCHERKLYRSLF